MGDLEIAQRIGSTQDDVTVLIKEIRIKLEKVVWYKFIKWFNNKVLEKQLSQYFQQIIKLAKRKLDILEVDLSELDLSESNIKKIKHVLQECLILLK